MQQHDRRSLPIGFVCLLTLLLVSAVKPVLAHGEGRTLQRGHVLVGNCYLTIWTAPAILRTGEVHIETTVSAQNGEPAPTALVHVTLTPHQQQALLLSAKAQPTLGTAGTMRTAAFNVQEAGTYRITVLVSDEAGGGKIEFDVEIHRISPLVRTLIYGQLLATLVAGLWLLHKGVTVWVGQRRPNASSAA